jgi:hypothetical protein
MYATPESLLAHYIKVAAMDKNFAWKRVQELAASSPVYADLPAELAKAMKEAARE